MSRLKKIVPFLIILFLTCGCIHRSIPNKTAKSQDMWHEDWQKKLTISKNEWFKAADSWFLRGEPNKTEQAFQKAHIDQSITVSAIEIPAVTDVRINGCFQTQIVGQMEENSLYIAGPNDAIRHIPVETSGNKIYIGQTKGAACKASMRHTIVRIGIAKMNRLAIYGGGPVEGRNILAEDLLIKFAGNSQAILAGSLDVRKILLKGKGTLTLIGVNTKNLAINAPGNGNLRLQGHIDLNNIHHAGSGSILIQGAQSKNLNIIASGGTTSLTGQKIQLKNITASKNSQVYIYGINGSYLNAKGSNNAIIGLAGQVDTLNVKLTGYAQFLGATLTARTGYINTDNHSHANAVGIRQLFTKATMNSSIYYNGHLANPSRFNVSSGLILPRN